MPLSETLRLTLRQAIQDYNFPCVTFDFNANEQIDHPSMYEVESRIQQQLLSDDLESVKDGFSNVLYWGYARMGYRWNRIRKLRERVTEQKLAKASDTLRRMNGIGTRTIAGLKLPQFSGFSFVSKVRMFLDPNQFVVMDIQILKLREAGLPTILDKVSHNDKETIRVTRIMNLSMNNGAVFAVELQYRNLVVWGFALLMLSAAFSI